MTDIKIYTTPACPYCMKAKALFQSLGVEYDEVDVAASPDIRQEMADKYQWQTVPMIVINGEFVGGYDVLAKLQASGELAEKLK